MLSFLYRELETNRKIRVPDGIQTNDLTDTGRVLNGGSYGMLSYSCKVHMCMCPKYCYCVEMKDGKPRFQDFSQFQRKSLGNKFGKFQVRLYEPGVPCLLRPQRCYPQINKQNIQKQAKSKPWLLEFGPFLFQTNEIKCRSMSCPTSYPCKDPVYVQGKCCKVCKGKSVQNLRDAFELTTVHFRIIVSLFLKTSLGVHPFI